MLIAQKLRKENIAEYLLYMWQVEDIIRAYGCNLQQIKKEYISRFDCTNEQKEEMVDWYGNLIRMINQEGCREKGHIPMSPIRLLSVGIIMTAVVAVEHRHTEVSIYLFRSIRALNIAGDMMSGTTITRTHIVAKGKGSARRRIDK